MSDVGLRVVQQVATLASGETFIFSSEFSEPYHVPFHAVFFQFLFHDGLEARPVGMKTSGEKRTSNQCLKTTFLRQKRLRWYGHVIGNEGSGEHHEEDAKYAGAGK